jgi:hypothetical protein
MSAKAFMIPQATNILRSLDSPQQYGIACFCLATTSVVEAEKKTTDLPCS